MVDFILAFFSLSENVTVKTLLKSVHIYQSYCKKNLAQFFWPTLYIPASWAHSAIQPHQFLLLHVTTQAAVHVVHPVVYVVDSSLPHRLSYLERNCTNKCSRLYSVFNSLLARLEPQHGRHIVRRQQPQIRVKYIARMHSSIFIARVTRPVTQKQGRSHEQHRAVFALTAGIEGVLVFTRHSYIVVPVGTAEARISYGNSVCLSVLHDPIRIQCQVR